MLRWFRLRWFRLRWAGDVGTGGAYVARRTAWGGSAKRVDNRRRARVG
ncbi:MAG TPA: hypothetical protein VGD53_31085 [Actinoallomurus sp.]